MDQQLLKRIYLTAFLLLLCVLFYNQIIRGDYYLNKAKNNYVRVVPIQSLRGYIYDRNGIQIAYDKPSYNIAVIPHQIWKNKQEVFAEIADYLKIDIKQIERNYRRQFINRFSPIDIVRDIDKKLAIEVQQNFSESIQVDPKPQRYYPYGESLSHILGYAQNASSHYEKLKTYGYTMLERAGFGGIEQYYDAYLKGEDGGYLLEVDASGRIVGFLGEREGKKGQDIYLTVDARYQAQAYQSLRGNRGCIIMMNSQTGEILTLVSSPAYDNNLFVKGKSVEQYLTAKNKPMINRAIQAVYPMGSTFKPLLGFAAIAEGKINSSTTFVCPGYFCIGNGVFKCMHVHGAQDFYQGLAHSCNVYFFNTGKLLGIELLNKWAKKFGLDSYSRIDLPYEKKGFIPTPEWQLKTFDESWTIGETINLSIGQGALSASPIEAMLAINSIANNGYMLKPYLLKTVESVDLGLSNRICLNLPGRGIEIVKEAMRQVVSSDSGTGRLLENLNLDIAGKTGTAQNSGASHGWFIGYWPRKNPKYTICVFVENGGTSYAAVKILYNFLKKLKDAGMIEQ